MKNYKEVANSVFEKSNTVIEENKRKKCIRIRIFAMVTPCVIIALSTLAVWNYGLFNNITSREQQGNDYSESIFSSVIPEDASETNSNYNGSVADIESDVDNPDIVVDTDDNALMHWKGKTVTVSLWDILNSANDDDIININLLPLIDRNDTSFLYNGKTLAEMIADREYSELLFDKVSTLIKLGDELKYGEALYTTGTPEGVKWTKEFYEKTVEYYGAEFLKEYIVSGEFLSDKVISDIEALSSELGKFYSEYQKACKEYIRFSLAKVNKLLEEENIKHTYFENGDMLTISVSRLQFEQLKLDGFEFSAENSRNESDLDDELQIPADDVIDMEDDITTENN